MKSSRRSFLLNPLSMLLAGLLLGIAAGLFDIYFQNLGEIFSQMAIWILLGTGIAIYSPTKKAAMGNIFPFCMGMLAAYYVTAAITHGVYSRTFIIGWTLFALPSPVMAYFAWMAKEPGAFSKIIAAGIAAVSVMYLPLAEDAEPPEFKACARHPQANGNGFVIYYTDQCPYTHYWVPRVEQAAKEHGIPLKTIHITTKEAAQNVPAPVTTYALFRDGKFVTQGIQSDKKLLALAGVKE